jgi:N-acetylmuramoyl-L-alanine amidase
VKKIDYTISIDGSEKKGTTDNEGWLQSYIKPNAKKAKIILDGGIEYEIALGYLNPADEISGVQGRLAHLGFYEGKIDGIFGIKTRNALKAFQVSHDFEPSGEIETPIQDLLIELTGA